MGLNKRKRTRWLERQRRDTAVQQARELGFRSRAALKLAQIDQRDRLLRPGLRVLDVGAAPGGWSQYAVPRVAPSGCVVAVDRLEMQPIAGVSFLHGDFTDPGVQSRLRERLPGRRADLVLSDMAPNITGIAPADEANWGTLAASLTDFVPEVLAEGGAFLVKFFQGPAVADWRSSMGKRFARQGVRKPGASRAQSREIYLIFKGFIGRDGG